MRENILGKADKDLICDFIEASVGRVLNRALLGWEKPVPQGVSVFLAHPDRGTFEYLFTKDEKFPVERDDPEEVLRCLNAYGSLETGGVVMYMNRCMLPVASKHRRFCY